MNEKNELTQPLSFEPITLSQAERVEALRRSFGNTLYVYTFASLFSWKEDEEYEIAFCNEAFIVKNKAEGKDAYLFPCGSDRGKKEIIDYLIQTERPVFYCMTDEDKLFVENEFQDKFHFADCRNEYSYLYDKEAQIELSGKAYKNLRHQINVGRAAAEEWSSEELCDKNADRAIYINQKWAEGRSANDLADVAASNTALKNFSKLSMWGLIFKADGKDIAYVAGSFVNPEIFDISFCKVLDSRCDCYVKWLLYCALPKEIKTVDSEEDLGLEGLRRHKLLRQPKELTRIWKGSLK